MSSSKRTRKGRPSRDAQRSALIVTRGKRTGRDAQVKPKQATKVVSAPRLESSLEVPDSIEAFLEQRATARDEDFDEAKIVDAREQKEVPSLASSALFESLSVPRRPRWTEETSAEELSELEQASFLRWRRSVAEAEEAERSRREQMLNGNGFLAPSATVSTPFERNLEVWRQLWRTLERSDCVFVIVDARWPEFYAPNDLLAYITSLGKTPIVVVNKADFLSVGQRETWARHWAKRDIACAFFSAKREQKRLDSEAAAAANKDDDKETVVMDQEEDDEAERQDESRPGEREPEEEDETTRLLRPHELLAIGERLARSVEPTKAEQGRPWCVGMVGYPNVGKSSCVNALRGATTHGVGARAAVSATPGKTKHLQTLLVGKDLELCDCPGLVFPALVANGAAELVCCGVVPLARARDPIGAAKLVGTRIAPAVFDLLYGTNVSRGASGKQSQQNFILDEFCEARRYKAAGSGVNDHRRAARDIVKDYVDGTMLYCHPPGECKGDDGALETFFADTRATALSESSALRAKFDAALLRTQKQNHVNARSAEVIKAADEAGFAVEDAVVPDHVRKLDREPVLPDSQRVTSGPALVKKANRWGKKGRKYRDPDPYGPKGDDLLPL